MPLLRLHKYSPACCLSGGSLSLSKPHASQGSADRDLASKLHGKNGKE
jgi:hypothetical protein